MSKTVQWIIGIVAALALIALGIFIYLWNKEKEAAKGVTATTPSGATVTIPPAVAAATTAAVAADTAAAARSSKRVSGYKS